MKIILVCGGRDYNDRQRIKQVLEGLDFQAILHGGYEGADTLAGQYARSHGIMEIRVDANWDFYKKSAGPIRNKWMIGLKPDLVVAFPGGWGTDNMMKTAIDNSIEVMEIHD